MRPQAEATRPATVVQYALALVELFECGADFPLFRLVRAGEGADDRCFGW
jgi:hypothetical protein